MDARRIVADQRPYEVRRDEPDEADDAGNGDARSNTRSNADQSHDAKHSKPDTTCARDVLAERQCRQTRARRKQEHPGDGHERSGHGNVTEAAILKRAQQPECDLQRREHIGREVEGKRHSRTCQTRQSQSCEK